MIEPLSLSIYIYGKMASTCESGSATVCSVLCFIQNKMKYLPADKLGEVVLCGDEIGKGKDLIFEAASKCVDLKSIRKKVRKHTGHKRRPKLM